MGNGQQGAGSRYFRMLFNVGTANGLTDAQLLERFTADGGESAELAFATLVERHGPMVLRVCRSVLRDFDEAHDAFQATFLVLVRRSGSLWVRDSLGPWLHQVAYRVASAARSAAARRRRHERRAADLSVPTVRDEDRDDLGEVLHDEVNRLSGGCRSAVVLCYFEGLSPEEAARQLGCPVGTVQSRLARGRARLRSRLTRRGLAPALGALGTGMAAEAAPALLPASLVESTVRAALAPSAVAGAVSGSVIQLTQGVLKSMFLIKARMVATSILTIAALAAGAGAMLQNGPDQKDLGQIRNELGLPAVDKDVAREPNQEAGPPPKDLTWTEVPPGEMLRVIELLAAQTKENYEKIKKWRGTYSYIIRQYLNEQFTAGLLTGVPPSGNAEPPVKAEPLMQEFDRVLEFAIDIGSNSIYRDVETRRMRFLKIGTDVEVKIPNVGASDHRWIVTPDRYLDFHPKDRATSSFLPDHPEVQNKRRAERYPASEARNRAGGEIDPREFFRFDPANSFWRGFEIYQKAFRGELGAETKKIIEERLKFEQAEDPGGRWYRERMGLGIPGQPMIWLTTLWSPQAGYNPVSRVTTVDKPDGKLQSKIEWQWQRFDRAYLPSMVKESRYHAPDGGPSWEQVSKLKECVLNRPLGLRQFDEQGLGLVDGDLILDHPEKVVYIIKGGESVKLANFGEGAILRPTPPKPMPAPKLAQATASKPGTQPTGRIYTTASLGTDDRGMPISSVVAIDPETGDVTKVFDRSPGRFRVSPDRRRVAYCSIEWWSNLPPAERAVECLWLHALAEDAKPERIVPLKAASSGVPIWSADGNQMILSLGTYDDARKQSTFETFRVNADGSGKELLKIPTEDNVQDWSPDGQWLLIASTRNAKIGWQLYIMRLDGSNQRQITEGGNPFYARFSPDGKRLLYTDGPWKIKEKRGVWVMDFDGKNRRRVFEIVKETASACWSPDGKRLAVAIRGAEPKDKGRLEIVDLDGAGTHRTLLTMPGQEIADMPDWR